MKILIGSVELEIKNGGRITYDSNTDTINIEPIQNIVRYTNRAEKPANPQLMIGHDTSNRSESTPLTKTSLTKTIMELVKSSNEPTPLISITKSCLGTGAGPNQIRYLKLLLEEMVDGGHLSMSVENGRRRFAIP
jgi:hypothetical protein